MGLEVGIDSYVDIEYADEYVRRYYLVGSTERVKWGELDTESKEIILRRSTEALEGIRYIGVKKIKSQSLSFPRVNSNDNIKYPNTPPVFKIVYQDFQRDVTLAPGGSYTDDGLESIKKAQVVNALGYTLSKDNIQDLDMKYGILGIKSESIGKASSSYEVDRVRLENLAGGLYNEVEVRKIMRLWISGAVV